MKKLLSILLFLPVFAQAQIIGCCDFSYIKKPVTGPSLTAFQTTITGTSVAGSDGTTVTYVLSGTVTGTQSILIAPVSSAWQVSVNGTSFGTTQTASVSGTYSVTVSARLISGNSSGTHNTTINNTISALSLSAPVTANGTTSAALSFSATPSSIVVNGTAGTPGTPATVTATYAGTTLSATFPANTQLSQDGGSTYTASSPQTITAASPAGLKLQTTAAAAAGSISGNLVISGSGVTTATIPVTGTVSSSGGALHTIKMQFWDSSRTLGKYVATGWNNVALTNGLHGTIHTSQTLFDTTLTGTSVSVSISNINDFSNSNGPTYAATNTFSPPFPAAAFQEVMFNTATPVTITLNNVPTGFSHYTVYIGCTTSLTTFTYANTFTSGSVSDNVNASANFSKIITLDGVDASTGTITIVNTFTSGQAGIINFIQLNYN